MPAFNSSQAFRDATSSLQQFGAYNFEQFRDALDQMKRQGAPADWIQQWATEYFLNRADNGFSSPEEIRAMGEQIMPGLGQTLADRVSRLNGIQDSYNEVPGSGDVSGRRMDHLNSQAEDIGRLGSSNQQEIDGTYGRASDRNAAATDSTIGDLGARYGGLASGVNDTLGGLRRANEGLTGGLAEDNDSTMRGLDRRAEGEFSDLRSRNATLGSSQSRDVSSTVGGLTRDSMSGFDDLASRTGSAYGGVRGDLGRTVSGLEDSSAATYGRLGTRTGETYDGLGDSADSLYGASLSETDMLRPAGTAEAARVGRSFAPVLANAKGRLRRMGIGPDSLQYMAQIADIEGDRARTMDDSASRSTAGYVDRRSDIRDRLQGSREGLGQNRLRTEIDLGLGDQDARERLGMTRYREGRDLSLGELDAGERQFMNRDTTRQRLGLGGLDRNLEIGDRTFGRDVQIADRAIGNRQDLASDRLNRDRSIREGGFGRESDLAVGQNDRVASLSREEGDLYRGEINRRNTTDTQLDYDRSARTMGNNREGYDLTSDWRDRVGDADINSRRMAMEDWNNRSNISREMNDNDLTALNLNNMQYDRGRDWAVDDRTTRDTGANAVMGLGNQARQNQFRFGTQAQQFGQGAQRSYADTANRQAGAGGWGTRLIGGLAGTALNALAPGVGSAIGGTFGNIVGGAMSGLGGMVGGGNRMAVMPGGGGQGGQGGGGGFGGFGGGILGTPPFVPQYQQRGTQAPTVVGRTSNTPPGQPNGWAVGGYQGNPISGNAPLPGVDNYSPWAQYGRIYS